jgi:O-antigen/teichoic acid export membrane protein
MSTEARPDSDVLATPAAGPAALRGSALRSASYFVGIALSLASAPLLVRHLGVVEFGRYVTVVSLMNLVAGVTEGGLNAIALREYVTLEGERRRETMRSLLGIRLALSTGGVGVGIAFALAAGYESPLVAGAVGAGVGVVLQAIQTLLTVPLQGRLRFGWTAALDLLRQVVVVALIVAGVLAGAGLVPFLYVTVPAGALALAITVWLVRRETPLRPALHRDVWWPLMRDTLPYTAAVAVNVVYFRVTILIMSLKASDVQTGYFATSFRVVEVLLGVPALVIGAAYPILARAVRDDEARYGYAMRRILDLAVIFGAWLTMNLVVGAELAIRILASHKADPAIGVLRIQGLALVATALAVGVGYGLLTLRRHAPMLWANGASLVTAVVLTLALVGGHGARGGAVATLAAEAVLATVQLAVLLRLQPSLATGLRGVPVTLAAAGAGVLAWWALDRPEVTGLLLANVIFVAGLLVTRRFPPEIRDALRR